MPDLCDRRTAGSSLPAPSAGHAAVTLEDGSLLIAGGSGEPARLGADGTSWSPAASLLAEEPGSTLTALADGGALLVGPNAPSLQRYFPDEDLWLTAGEARVARSGHTATRLLDGQDAQDLRAQVAKEAQKLGLRPLARAAMK